MEILLEGAKGRSEQAEKESMNWKTELWKWLNQKNRKEQDWRTEEKYQP